MLDCFVQFFMFQANAFGFYKVLLTIIQNEFMHKPDICTKTTHQNAAQASYILNQDR
jgi:hypothetical protein